MVESRSGFGPVLLLLILVGMSLCSCTPNTPSETPEKIAPAKVDGAVQESALATILLTTQAEERLGIQTVPLQYASVNETRTYAGEVVIPPDQTITVTAPVSGKLVAPESGDFPRAGSLVKRGHLFFHLLPLERDLRGRNLLAEAEQELTSSEVRVQAAELNLKRAEQLLRDKAGSVRSLEQARAELEQANAARTGAQAQVEYLKSAPLEAGDGLPIESPQDGVLTQMHASPGQSVAPGSPLFEVGGFDPLWLRVPVYVGELPLLAKNRPAITHELGASAGSSRSTARPVTAPPSANASTATVDLYYELPNGSREFRPGQKLGVTLTLQGDTEKLAVPWSAIIYDAHGGTWIYENSGPQTYVRRRIELSHLDGETAVLARGPEPGISVVITGAAELFGTEFGTGR